jgi:hypothetical protein
MNDEEKIQWSLLSGAQTMSGPAPECVICGVPTWYGEECSNCLTVRTRRESIWLRLARWVVR